jgi:hypothetical protein
MVDSLELLVGELKALQTPVDASSFRAARVHVRKLGGDHAVRRALEAAGFVSNGILTNGTQPFNFFARVATGEIVQPQCALENEALGESASRFIIAANRQENDDHWSSNDSEWVGKASMAERHRFLTIRDMSWQWFNVLTFALDETSTSLLQAIEVLEAMVDAARTFARTTPGWSAEPDRLGMYFHCFPHNSVNSLHMHLVDLSVTGPTFAHHAHKNIPVESVLEVLRSELADVNKQRWLSSPAALLAAAVAMCIVALGITS